MRHVYAFIILFYVIDMTFVSCCFCFHFYRFFTDIITFGLKLWNGSYKLLKTHD